MTDTTSGNRTLTLDPLDNRAQNTSSLFGKLLRLDVNGTGAVPCGQTDPMPYAIQPSNPFVGVAGAGSTYVPIHGAGDAIVFEQVVICGAIEARAGPCVWYSGVLRYSGIGLGAAPPFLRFLSIFGFFFSLLLRI